MKTILLLLAALTLCQSAATAFVVQPSASSIGQRSIVPVSASWTAPTILQASVAVVDDETEIEVTDKGLAKRNRYIAMNRFAVRANKAAKFEQRWATRKSKLATLQGFKYFHLMRRVTIDSADNSVVYDEGTTSDESFENYMSFTIWNKKSDFSLWRNGEAFKEAHGGTSISAFLSTMVNSALVLRGAPKPAFYDSIVLQSKQQESIPQLIDGWRTVPADGITTLSTESFIQFTKYFVPTGTSATTFEKYFLSLSNDIDMTSVPGFVASSIMRRDGQAKGHGVAPVEPTEPTYVSVMIFQDRQSFDAWSKSNTVTISPPSQMTPPKVEYYEGTLVISSPDGA